MEKGLCWLSAILHRQGRSGSRREEGIYEPCIAEIQRKYEHLGERRFGVIGLWMGARGTANGERVDNRSSTSSTASDCRKTKSQSLPNDVSSIQLKWFTILYTQTNQTSHFQTEMNNSQSDGISGFLVWSRQSRFCC